MNPLVELSVQTSVRESKFSLIIHLLRAICICPDNYSFSVLKCFKMCTVPSVGVCSAQK